MVVEQLLVNAGSKVDVAPVDARNGGLWQMERLECFFDALLQFQQVQNTRIGASGLQVFRNRNHAVVGAEGNDVIAAADFLIEMREEIAKVFVEADENVLNFAAARAESVADVIHGGITDSEKIGAPGFAKIHGVDGFLGEFGKSRVGVGTGGPLAVKRGVGLAVAVLSAQRMRKGEIPAVGRNRPEGLLSIPVGFFR